MTHVPFHQYWQLLKNYLRPQLSLVAFLACFLFANIALQLINPRRNICFLLLIFWLAFPDIAATDSGVAAYKVKAYRTVQIVKIDGELNEPDWQNAEPISQFIQVVPDEGKRITQPTEARILYDKQNLYFGFTCFDSDMSKLVANDMRRDGHLYRDDNVFVLLDTYNDQRNGFFFRVNPLGALQESAVIKGGTSVHLSWNVVWASRTRITKDHWTAEIAIPFSQLRFKPSAKMTWGLNLGRKIIRNEEEAIWIPMPKSYGPWAKVRTVNLGRLVGLDGITPSRHIELLPYALPGFSRSSQGEMETKRVLDVGLDLKYGLTSNLTADLTFNTDFAQVEADEEQVNLTRFSLYFPEKRPFFLEGAGLFEFGIPRPGYYRPPPLLLFYSRRIGLEEGHAIPISAGSKIAGKIGSYGIGFLNVLTNEFRTDESVTDPDDTLDVPRTNYSVLRMQRDIFDRSSIGVIAINKQDVDTYNRAGGFDFAYRPTDSLDFRGLWARTFEDDASGESDAWYFGGNWQNNRFRLRGAYTAIDENFNPEVGFVQRKGMRRISSDIRYTGWPRRYGIRQIDVTPELDYILNQDNELETREFSLVNSFFLESRERISFRAQRNFEYLDTDFEIQEGIVIPVGEYNFNSFRGSVFTDDSKKISGEFGANFGDFFNGERQGFDIKVAFKPNKHFRFEPQYQFNRITLPIDVFNVSIFGSRVSYFVSTTLFGKLFAQWNSDSDEVFTNFLLSYEYQPGSNFYLVFNQTFDIDNAEVELMDSTVVAKITYWWNM